MTQILNLRGPDGLLLGIQHPKNPDNRVNWRAMLKPEHLYVNPDYEDELKMKFGVKSRRDIDVTQCTDNELLVLLEGWRYLLKLRGVRSVDIKMDHVSETKASATCTIELIGNYETGGEMERWSDTGSASLYSVSGSFQLHLEAMAANRALARCARAALGVKIYGKDEYDPKANKQYESALKEQGQSPIIAAKFPVTQVIVEDKKSVAIKPQDRLAELCAKLSKKGSHTFEKIKEGAIKANKDIEEENNAGLLTKDDFPSKPMPFESDPNTWTSFQDIPNRDVWTLLEKIQKAAESKKSKA